jgi:hypothetical protein
VQLPRSRAASSHLPPRCLHGVPRRDFQAPRHWVKRAYHNLIYYNEVDRGGRFAAWEEPDLFASEMRAAFKSLR